MATYKGDLLTDLDRMCGAKGQATKLIKKEAGKYKSKISDRKDNKKTSKQRYSSSPLTRACDIEKSLNKQGFKVPSVSCE